MKQFMGSIDQMMDAELAWMAEVSVHGSVDDGRTCRRGVRFDFGKICATGWKGPGILVASPRRMSAAMPAGRCMVWLGVRSLLGAGNDNEGLQKVVGGAAVPFTVEDEEERMMIVRGRGPVSTALY
jgi:hypothetical protein